MSAVRAAGVPLEKRGCFAALLECSCMLPRPPPMPPNHAFGRQSPHGSSAESPGISSASGATPQPNTPREREPVWRENTPRESFYSVLSSGGNGDTAAISAGAVAGYLPADGKDEEKDGAAFSRAPPFRPAEVFGGSPVCCDCFASHCCVALCCFREGPSPLTDSRGGALSSTPLLLFRAQLCTVLS